VIENVAAGFDNYTVVVRGYTSGDGENVGVYIWENQGASWGWRFLDNLDNTGAKTITFTIQAGDLTKYLDGDNIHLRYLENSSDNTQTILHLDLSIVQENLLILPSPLVDNVTVDNSYLYNFTTDHTYWWRVRATVDDVVGSWSEIWSVTLDRVAPNRPQPLTPADGENVGTPTPTLSWTAPPENAYPILYHVQIATNGAFTPVYWDSGWISDTSCTPPSLPDNFYYWWVQAKDNAGNLGEFSISQTFRVDTVPPDAPSVISPVEVNVPDVRPTFKWSPPAENSLPRLYKVKIYDDAMSLYLSSFWTSEENWQPGTDLANGRYWWTVTAKDNAGNIGENSSPRWFRVDTVVPKKPALQWPADGENVSTSSPNLDWLQVTEDNLGNTEPSTPVAYYVAISDASSFSYENYSSGWITDDNWLIPSLPDGTWYWRVMPRDNAGNIGENSASRMFGVDTTPPSVWLDWTTGTDNHGPVLYRLLVSTFENFAQLYLDTGWVDNDNWYLENLFDNRYYWKVQTRDNLLNLYETPARWFVIENSAPSRPELIWPDNDTWITDNTDSGRQLGGLAPAGGRGCLLLVGAGQGQHWKTKRKFGRQSFQVGQHYSFNTDAANSWKLFRHGG